jgi:hypothetical protein
MVSIVSLLRLDLGHDLGVGDLPVVLGWDLVVQDGKYSVGTFDKLTIVKTGANALA